MKGAKRLLSVFLLLVIFCTFLVFPAGAVGEGQIPNFSNSAWQVGGGDVGRPSNGSYVFGNGSNGCSLFLALNLQPGERYKISGKFTLTGNTSSPDYYVSLLPSEGSEIILVDQKTKGVVNVDTEFVVPDNGGGFVILFIALGAWSTLEYNSNWKIENTSTDKGILNSIKEGFSKLWEWLQGIWDSIKEIPTKIGQFITNLGDRISTFFSNLTNSIKGFFSDLWDKIWNGDGSVPPFDNNNKFAQVIEKLNEWTAKIKEFSGSVDSSADTVTGYLQSGTSFLNSAMGAFPAALTAVLGFALVFIVVRKVVGR